jgi:hypothetical protein
MAKAKKRNDRVPTIPKKRKPQDATLRNVRAANTKFKRLNDTLERQLVPMLRALTRRVEALETWRAYSERNELV